MADSADSNPYLDLPDKERMDMRRQLLMDIIQSEGDFVLDMDTFLQEFVDPILVRDNAFKRSFLSESSIAVTLNLYRDIYTACNAFSLSLQSATSGEAFAKAYVQFASSLRLFAQFASVNVSCLNSLKGFGKQLRAYLRENTLPEDMTIESAIVQPIQHYTTYRQQFQNIVWLTPSSRPETQALLDAMEVVRTIY